MASPTMCSYGGLQALYQLYTSLLLHLTDTEKRGPNDSNDGRGHEIEGPFIMVLGIVPDILAETVEDANYGTTDD